MFISGSKSKYIIVLGGLATIALSICSLGYASAFAARYDTDKKLFFSFREIVSPDDLPSYVEFVSVDMDLWLPGREYELGSVMSGALETHWSGCAGFLRAYHDKLIAFVPRWRGWMKFYEYAPERVESSLCNSEVTTGVPKPLLRPSFYINWYSVDPRYAVVFTTNKNKPVLIRSMRLQRKDGTEKVVTFPLVEKIDPKGRNSLESFTVFLEDQTPR